VTFATLPNQLAVARLRVKLLVAGLLGGVMALGHSPVGWPLATLLALGAVFWLFGTVGSARQAAAFGWLVGTGYFAATVYWIVNPFLVDAPQQAWMAPFALVFMAVGLALFWALAFWAAHWLGGAKKRRLLALIFTLTLAELARSYVLTGFPWGLLGYVWVDTWVIQWAAWVGPHGVGMLTLCMTALPWIARDMRRGGLLAVALLAFVWLAGHLNTENTDTAMVQANPVRVRLIQPNAPQAEKWDRDYAAMFFQRQLDLTAEPSEIPIDLVIWPETAVPFWLESVPNYQRQIAQAAGSATAIIGAVRDDAGKAYNALAVLGPDGTPKQVYDKSHLVPFGEYTPFGGWMADIGLHGFASSEGDGFSAGASARVLDLGRAGKILPLICYEAIFPQLVNSWTTRPDWILQITNDAWFGQIAGPQQHLAQARVRAIEQGLPLVRVANTGISAVIDARGQVVAELPLNTIGKLDAFLPAKAARTVYSRTGDWLVFLLALAGVLFLRRNRCMI